MLEPFDIYNAILQLIFVSISIIVGLKIISKFFKYKKKTLLLVGLTWIGMVEPWMASCSSFLFTITTGMMFSVEIYLLIGMFFLPMTLIIWFIAFTDLLLKEKQKIILFVIAIYGVLFETFFLFFLFTEPSVVGILHGPIDIEYGLLIQSYLFSVLVLTLITGVLFARKTLNVEDAEIRLKGKFLLIAFISFVIGSISDTIFTANIVELLITRIILISASFEFYCGFILPKWMKKLFILEK
ncbi:MAG: hypothetical protein ACTSRI_19605 [Promethearchaeota archaeon]